MITFAEESAERCAICKLYLLRHHREQWIGLVPADEGAKVWLCKECFDTPLEYIFMRKDGEMPKKEAVLM